MRFQSALTRVFKKNHFRAGWVIPRLRTNKVHPRSNRAGKFFFRLKGL